MNHNFINNYDVCLIFANINYNMIFKVFVVIVTYNGARWIEKCIGSVYRSNIKATPIVVDNGSSDGTLDIIKTKFPQCLVVETNNNLGFGKANNIGIKIALEQSADYIYLLNQDAWVEPDVFKIMISVQQQNPTFGILSPLQMNGLGSDFDANFRKNTISEDRCPGFLSDYTKYTLKDLYESKAVIAAHWLIYAPYIKRVGLFAPAFPHYGEDSNLYQRFVYWGYKIGVCSRAKGYHDRQNRKPTPHQILYFKYIRLLVVTNNINIKSSIFVFQKYSRFVYGVLCYRQCSLKERMTTIYKGTKALIKSGKNKKEYRKEYNAIWKI